MLLLQTSVSTFTETKRQFSELIYCCIFGSVERFMLHLFSYHCQHFFVDSLFLSGFPITTQPKNLKLLVQAHRLDLILTIGLCVTRNVGIE